MYTTSAKRETEDRGRGGGGGRRGRVSPLRGEALLRELAGRAEPAVLPLVPLDFGEVQIAQLLPIRLALRFDLVWPSDQT